MLVSAQNPRSFAAGYRTLTQEWNTGEFLRSFCSPTGRIRSTFASNMLSRTAERAGPIPIFSMSTRRESTLSVTERRFTCSLAKKWWDQSNSSTRAIIRRWCSSPPSRVLISPVLSTVRSKFGGRASSRSSAHNGLVYQRGRVRVRCDNQLQAIPKLVL